MSMLFGGVLGDAASSGATASAPTASITFDSTTQQVLTLGTPFNISGEFTIGFWVQFTSLTQKDNTIFSDDDGDQAINFNSDIYNLFIPSTNYLQGDIANKVVTGQWYYYAATRDVNNNFTLYRSVGTGATTLYDGPTSGTGASIIFDTIGAHTTKSPARYGDFYLGEVRVYNTALDKVTIDNLKDKVLVEPENITNLILYLRGDDAASQTTIADTSPSASNATLSSNNTQGPPPPVAANSAGGTVCFTPSVGAVSGISSTTGTISWSTISGAVSYDLRYRATGTTPWTDVTGITATSYAITGLTDATEYEAQVRTFCGSATNSGYSASVTWTTGASGGTTYTPTVARAVAIDHPGYHLEQLGLPTGMSDANTEFHIITNMANSGSGSIEAAMTTASANPSNHHIFLWATGGVRNMGGSYRIRDKDNFGVSYATVPLIYHCGATAPSKVVYIGTELEVNNCDNFVVEHIAARANVNNGFWKSISTDGAGTDNCYFRHVEGYGSGDECISIKGSGHTNGSAAAVYRSLYGIGSTITSKGSNFDSMQYMDVIESAALYFSQRKFLCDATFLYSTGFIAGIDGRGSQLRDGDINNGGPFQPVLHFVDKFRYVNGGSNDRNTISFFTQSGLYYTGSKWIFKDCENIASDGTVRTVGVTSGYGVNGFNTSDANQTQFALFLQQNGYDTAGGSQYSANSQVLANIFTSESGVSEWTSGKPANVSSSTLSVTDIMHNAGSHPGLRTGGIDDDTLTRTLQLDVINRTATYGTSTALSSLPLTATGTTPSLSGGRTVDANDLGTLGSLQDLSWFTNSANNRFDVMSNGQYRFQQQIEIYRRVAEGR